MRFATLALGLSMVVSPLYAKDYMHLTCSDLSHEKSSVAFIVGWLDLQNRDRFTQDMDFARTEQHVDMLAKECASNPDMPVYVAVDSTFEEMDVHSLQANPQAQKTDAISVSSIQR